MWTINWVDRTGSTNADVAAAARAGTAEGLVLATGYQDAGRGRLDRIWAAPAGTSLAVSFLLRPARIPLARWPWLPLLAGVAFADAIRDVAGVDAMLKWPNDVLVGGRKLAGILVERVEDEAGAAAVVGIGVNISQAEQQLPPNAVSLALAVGETGEPPPDSHAVLAALAGRLAERYVSWRAAAGEPTGSLAGDPAGGLAAAYARRCDTLGREVRAELPGCGVLQGRATGIDDSGRLVVDTPGGPVPVSAGDVVHLRPA